MNKLEWKWQIVDKDNSLWSNQKFLFDNAKFLCYHLNHDPKYKDKAPYAMQECDDYWITEQLDGKQKITIPLSNVDMITSANQLLVNAAAIFNQDDIVRIGDIEAVITGGKLADKHNWILDIDCDQMDKLRELLAVQGD